LQDPWIRIYTDPDKVAEPMAMNIFNNLRSFNVRKIKAMINVVRTQVPASSYELLGNLTIKQRGEG